MTPEEKDALIVSLHHEGKSVSEIVDQTGLKKSKVYKAIQNEKKNIKPHYRKQGRKDGEKRLLSDDQLKQLQKDLTTKPPMKIPSLHCKDKFWTYQSIQTLLESDAYDTCPSHNTIVNYLNRLSLRHPKPNIDKASGKGDKVLHISLYQLSKKPYVYVIYAYDCKGKYYFYVTEAIGNDFFTSLSDMMKEFERNNTKFDKVVCSIPEAYYSIDPTPLWRSKEKSEELYSSNNILFQIIRKE